MARLKYFLRSALHSLQRASFVCQNCGADDRTVVDRKYLVTQLNRCGGCGLLYRTPVDTAADNVAFYNEDYEQGFTTELPDDVRLAEMLANDFADTEKDYGYYITVLEALGIAPGMAVFDYGCSWGYGSYQLRRHGYEVVATEVSRSRGGFAAEKLGVRLFDDFDALAPGHDLYGHFDAFFSAHVIEHVPAPQRVFDVAHAMLKDGGVFVAFTPNGSESCRRANPDWHKLWGEVHPNFVDEAFLRRSFAHSPRVFGSSPVDPALLASFAACDHELAVNDLAGTELVFATRKRSEHGGW